MKKTIQIPERRYAMFSDIIGGDYLLLITGNGLKTAPKWGGFVKWFGGVKRAEERKVKI